MSKKKHKPLNKLKGHVENGAMPKDLPKLYGMIIRQRQQRRFVEVDGERMSPDDAIRSTLNNSGQDSQTQA